MLTDVSCLGSGDGIRIQNLFYHVFALLGYETWYEIIAVENFLIEFASVRILKWQVSTRHGIQNDTQAPNVCGKTIITSPCYHFWSCITRTSTGSFKHLTLLVGVTQTEIHNLDVVVLIQE
jgi:hypothetical protein